MANPKDKRLRRLRELRRRSLRIAKRARIRRAKIVSRRHRRRARWLLRKIRHRRKVLSLSKKRRAGLVWYDGKQVAAWVADELDKAKRYGWRGYVVSGYRTPAYSEHLCYAMCGAPRCPGRCAGRSSNHSQGYFFPRGAVDVTDYARLQDICQKYHLRIHNALPRDRVHFSNSGQ